MIVTIGKKTKAKHTKAKQITLLNYQPLFILIYIDLNLRFLQFIIMALLTLEVQYTIHA
jgi:hypothetical protein